jgi:ligand-binding sensor domain-containing protein
MNTYYFKTVPFLLLVILFFISSCSRQNKKSVDTKAESNTYTIAGDTVSEIDGEIRSIFQDSKNNIWFASNGEGVYKYNPSASLTPGGKNIQQFTEKHGLFNNSVWNIKEGKDGNIWFWQGTKQSQGICFFDGKKFSPVTMSANDFQLPNHNFVQDDIFSGSYYTGHSLIPIHLPETSPIQNEENKRFHYDIFSTCKDSKGNLWFGTCTAGICKYDGKTYTWFDNKELGSAIRVIFEDRSGTIWAGNNGDGLFRLDGNNFINFSKEKNLHNPDFEKYPIGKPGLLSRVWTIADDKDGNLWIGTIDNGVWKYDPSADQTGRNSLTNYTTKDGLGIDAIWIIYRDKKNQLWFGTAGDGVYTFNGERFEKWPS